jgi:hypothetical protein
MMTLKGNKTVGVLTAFFIASNTSKRRIASPAYPTYKIRKEFPGYSTLENADKNMGTAKNLHCG